MISRLKNAYQSISKICARCLRNILKTKSFEVETHINMIFLPFRYGYVLCEKIWFRRLHLHVVRELCWYLPAQLCHLWLFISYVRCQVDNDVFLRKFKIQRYQSDFTLVRRFRISITIFFVFLTVFFCPYKTFS